MVVDSDIVLCGRNTIFHCQQHISDHVHEDGRTEWRNGAVHQPSLSSMDIEAALEPACGYIQDQEMVDCDDADYHVGSIRPAHIQHPSSFQ